MVRFAANLSMMFREVAFVDRFEAAAAAGFRGVEYRSPYAFTASEISSRLKDYGLEQVLFNTPAGDWDAGDRGMACNPSRVSEFREGISLAIEYANALECNKIHCMAGLKPEGFDASKIHQTYIENLRFAAAEMERSGIKCLIEMINTGDMPGYYLNRSAQAEDIMVKAAAGNLYIQYDIYHMQIMEGDLAPSISRLLPKIAHMQLADTPGRHEPGTGDIDYPLLFRHIERIGYQGWIGCEYIPATTTLAGLGWIDGRAG